MKRGILISILVAFLTVICVLEQILVSTTLEKLNFLTNNLKDYYNESNEVLNNETLNRTQNLKEFWQKNENLLCFFINHKDMEEVGIELNKMLSFIETNNKEEFLISLNLVIYYSKTFNHIMGLSIQNLI